MQRQTFTGARFYRAIMWINSFMTEVDIETRKSKGIVESKDCQENSVTNITLKRLCPSPLKKARICLYGSQIPIKNIYVDQKSILVSNSYQVDPHIRHFFLIKRGTAKLKRHS